jgi:signal transduction histidine kinase
LTFQVRLAIGKTEQMAAAGTPVSADWAQAQLRGVEQRLHRLLETLDRLLDVSRLSTGRIDLQFETVNLGEVVREVVGTLDAQLAMARCQLMLSERGEDSTGTWDRLRVEQICRNLLSNAIRFGAGRPIEVEVIGHRDHATLMVCDHGIGIAREQQARIFERFERGEQRSGGFGIGLWMARTICAAMSGTLDVASEVGQGACFTVMLPIHNARERSAGGSPRSAAPPIEAL